MKRYGYVIEKITDYNNILCAYYKALIGHRYSIQALIFLANLEENIRKISFAFEHGKIIINPFHKFIITDPKRRQICAPTFFDRVEHHAIMNVCHDIFDRRLIYDTYASRPGKGVYAALNRIMNFSRKYDFYVKLDVRKYFDSIDHVILKKELMRVFKDTRLLKIFDQIIDSYAVLPGKGIPIGNLTSQYFANLYLSKIDYYMKCECGVKGYVRYMDDVFMFGRNRQEIKRYLDLYVLFAKKELLLEIKPPILGVSSLGILALGYKIFPRHMRLSGKSKRRFKNKIMALFRDLKDEKITQKQFASKAIPLIAFAKHAETKEFRRNIFDKIE